MNFHEELELLIRVGYPVLSIISSKQTWDLKAAVEFANKRRITTSREAATPTSTYLRHQPSDTVQGAARRKN